MLRVSPLFTYVFVVGNGAKGVIGLFAATLASLINIIYEKSITVDLFMMRYLSDLLF